MTKEYRRSIRLTEEENEKVNKIISESDIVKTFNQLFLYLLNYYEKTQHREKFIEKIIQENSRKIDLNYNALLEYVKILSPMAVRDFENVKYKVEKDYENEMKSKLVKKNDSIY
ncbi:MULTISPECIES: hypothetical protein [Aerococcus]|uniref:hypothetical protein n=1 Tax=Aerococcus TaxID=1375 RepID=UPI0018A78D52|nr:MULTISPECIES: hypothetical protein [Aerococcus]MCY3067603.1 hypothetical protein [Aerococcus mictus]MCY3080495.1 hypothetical protein [Aerococcus mictus]MDK8484558.1 hypothetical protein [Aerococcus urinae]